MAIGYLSPQARANWTVRVFRANAAKSGGVVRRAVADVKQYGSFRVLKREVLRRQFHLIRTGDQYVILCHRGELRLIC
jgi:hypothetical protein